MLHLIVLVRSGDDRRIPLKIIEGRLRGYSTIAVRLGDASIRKICRSVANRFIERLSRSACKQNDSVPRTAAASVFDVQLHRSNEHTMCRSYET